MVTSAEIRQQLVTALRRDLIRPAAQELDPQPGASDPASFDLIRHRPPGEEVLLLQTLGVERGERRS